MKDKEKQIEEMVKVMCGYDCEECAKESAEFFKQTIEEARNNDCLFKNCAKTLYEQGYRKIDKDSIILSREEYERLKGKRQSCNCETLIKQARKETAERCIKDVREMLRDCDTVYEDDGYHISPDVGYLKKDVDDGLNKIAKEFGVEIKE